MTTNLSPSEQLIYSTLRIECELQDGGLATATGFFYKFGGAGDSYIPAIVTNKHAIRGAKRGRLHFHLADPNGQLITDRYGSFLLENFESSWIGHPDQSVDLCIMPIAPLVNQAKADGNNIFYVYLDKALIPTAEELSELSSVEEIITIGYPHGIWDAVNNRPIVQRGITATSPNLNYNGRQELAIDSTWFLGSSGSPVFIFNLGNYTDKYGAMVMGTRIKLLGILYAIPQYNSAGEVQITNIPIQQRQVAFSRISNSLCIAIKSQKLLDFDPIVQQMLQNVGTVGNA